MSRPVLTVFIEAFVIGLMNLAIFYFLASFTRLNPWIILIICGMIIHLSLEYSPFGNLNEAWCRDRFP